MPYVQRDQSGHVIGLSHVQQFPGQEFDANAVLYFSPEQMVAQKQALLITAQQYRETLMSRLTWLKTECVEALSAAQVAEDEAAILLQTNNLTAIETAIDNLVNAFKDPRVVAAINGEVKLAIQTVYAEIVQAFKVAAPALHARMKKLDALS